MTPVTDLDVVLSCELPVGRIGPNPRGLPSRPRVRQQGLDPRMGLDLDRLRPPVGGLFVGGVTP